MLKRISQKTMRVGTNKKMIIFLWGLLIISFCFAVYKNFTAINIHTINTKEVIKQEVVDTNDLESYVKDFAEVYYAWDNNKQSIESRLKSLSNYLTRELLILNNKTISDVIPTSSKVLDIKIHNVDFVKNSNFKVTFTVHQNIIENNSSKDIEATFFVIVHKDKQGDMVVVRNPTICKQPKKSKFEPKKQESDGTVGIQTQEEITRFLETFFKLYPTASKEELAYYVKGNALDTVNRNYIFKELLETTYKKENNIIIVFVSVSYLDNETKATQISEFELKLLKESNWIIVK